jgi:predicted CoA-binding protein
MFTQQDIRDFLSVKRVAVAGMSRDEKKFSRLLLKKLISEGFSVLPINPHAQQIESLVCYPSVSDLPADVSHLIVITNKKESQQVIQQAIDKGIKRIWVQQGSETPEVMALAKNNSHGLITGECLFMWLGPVTGFHSFHRFMRRVFSGLPPKA